MVSIKTKLPLNSFKRLRRVVKVLLLRSSQNPIIAVLLLAMAASLLTLYFSADRGVEGRGGRAIFEQRDFSFTPFSLMDAYDACVLEAKSKLGNSILRTHMLPLSTRYQQDKGTYMVVLSADVGTVEEWSVMTIYCTVDPNAHEISYYKEIYDGQPSLLSRTMSLLGELLN